MKNRTFLLLFSLSLIGLISCTKKKIVYTPVDAYLREHYDFKVGSYWIYKDSASGNEDSFVVTEHHIDTVLEQNNATKEEHQQVIYSKIRQFHNNIMYDTIVWSFGIQTNYLSFGGGFHGMGQVILNQTETKNITIQGVLYTDVKMAKSGGYILYLKDNIGPLRFNFNDKINEVLRYQIQ